MSGDGTGARPKPGREEQLSPWNTQISRTCPVEGEERNLKMKKMVDFEMYTSILREELLLAMGCTEPVAVAYAAATARSLLPAGTLPDRCQLYVSGNIIKNVKSVVVPNTDGLHGLEAAAAVGIVGGDEKAGLQVISQVTPEQREGTRRLLEHCKFTVCPAKTEKIFYIEVRLYAGTEETCAMIEDFHTNLTRMERNHTPMPLPKNDCGEAETRVLTDRSRMNVEDILEFSAQVDLDPLRELLERQISCNMAIAEEGLKNPWGAQVGRTLLKAAPDDPYTRAAAAAAAGSDARMGGCELPVAIVSGSGNQGLTASVPVVVYGREKGVPHDTLLRALLVSDLITIHQKTGIGRLSAFCGATSAGVGAACGIAWLDGADYQVIAHIIVNSLAILSGMVCDGAKASCAAKIATAVNNGLLGYRLYRDGLQFYGGDGIVTKGVENTIANVGRLAREGMRSTDCEILDIMVGS